MIEFIENRGDLLNNASEFDQFMIRTSLDESALDITLPIGNKSHFGGREWTVRMMAILAIAAVAYIGLLTHSPLGPTSGGFLGSFIGSIGYWYFIALIVAPTQSQEIGMSYLLSFGPYFSKSLQNVSTRNVAYEKPVSNLFAIAENGIDVNGGIHYTDGSVGRIYELVGNASAMMFPSDRYRILDDTRTFYRAIRSSTAFTIDTVRLPQRIKPQLKAKDIQIQNLNPLLKGTGLEKLLREEKRVLQAFVGKQFLTIHQYMIVHSTSEQELTTFDNWIDSQLTMGSTYMKTARRLDSEEEVVSYFGSIFKANAKANLVER